MASHKHTSPRQPSQKPVTFPKFILLGVALLALGLTGGFTAMQFENHDSFCASCHSEPETTYFGRESAAPIDLASFHSAKQVNCIDCHSGQGLVPGRISSLMLGAKDLFAWISGHSTQPAPQTRPIDDVNCLKCHADVTRRRDFNNHFHIFLARWQATDKNAATCVSCHQSHTINGEQNIAFLNRVMTTSVCQSCHNFAGRGE